MTPSSAVRDLGVYVDSGLSVRSPVQWTILRCFTVLHQLCTFQIPTAVFQSLIVALILSRLDYCNSVLFGLPANLIQHLQSIQNAAAQLIFRIRWSEHITPALISLHRLRVLERISIHGTPPSYLQSFFSHVADMTSRQRLRSSASHHLEIPPVRLYSRQAGIASCRHQHVERPSVPRHICTVTHSFQAAFQDFPSFLVPAWTSWYDLFIIISYQKEMATYRHWSVSLRRDPDDVPHCQILSPDKTEWRLISATLCGWRQCFVADQLW